MKKIICFLLAFTMLFALCSCGKQAELDNYKKQMQAKVDEYENQIEQLNSSVSELTSKTLSQEKEIEQLEKEVEENKSKLDQFKGKIYDIYEKYENVNFANDRVIVVINNEESLKFKEYSVSDFPEIELKKVENLSKPLEERIQKQIKGENDFTTTIDITRFRLMLLLHLKNSGRSEVLNSIAILTNRYDVECAEPNVIFEVDLGF